MHTIERIAKELTDTGVSEYRGHNIKYKHGRITSIIYDCLTVFKSVEQVVNYIDKYYRFIAEKTKNKIEENQRN